jgi:tetratricopeptide (TPR) repeat protein
MRGLLNQAIFSWILISSQTVVLAQQRTTCQPGAESSAAARQEGKSAQAYDVAGLASLKSNDPSCALEDFRLALDADPQAQLPRYHEAIAYQSLGNYERAAQDFETVLKQREGFAEAHIGLGEAEEALGRNADAEMNYRRAVALEPNSSQATSHLASVLEKESQPAAAINYWKRALASQPESQSLRFSLAVAYLNSGQNEIAAQQFSEIVKKQPDSEDAWIDLGTSLSRQDRYPEAVEAYKRAATLPGVHDLALLSLSKALITLLRYSEAVPYLNRYVQDHPGDAQGHTLEGIADRGLGELSQAEQELKQAVELDGKDYDGQYNLGAVLRQERKEQEAIAHLKAAIGLRPDSGEAHYQLSRAYYDSRQMSLAAEQERVLSVEEQARTTATRITVLGNQALTALDHHDFQTAVNLYKQIIDLSPTNAKARFDLALVYEKLGDRVQEQTLLHEAIAIEPSLACAHSQLGYLAMLDGKTDPAESEFKLALQADPRFVQALGNLGVLYGRMQRLDEATHLLQLATDNDPNYATGYLNLGLISAVRGRYREAIEELQQSPAMRKKRDEKL